MSRDLKYLQFCIIGSVEFKILLALVSREMKETFVQSQQSSIRSEEDFQLRSLGKFQPNSSTQIL